MQLPDVGKLTGTYFLCLGWLMIGLILVRAIFYDALHVDASFALWLLLGTHLRKHSPSARKWTIGLTCIATFMCLVMMIIIVVMYSMGEPLGIIRFGEYVNDDPPLWMAMLEASVALLMVAVPLALLLTPQARREFAQPAQQIPAPNPFRTVRRRQPG